MMTIRIIDGGADADANADADTDAEADADADADVDVDADTKVDANAVVTKCRTELFNRVGNVSRGDVNFAIIIILIILELWQEHKFESWENIQHLLCLFYPLPPTGMSCLKM